jgi:transmembrane sensor
VGEGARAKARAGEGFFSRGLLAAAAVLVVVLAGMFYFTSRPNGTTYATDRALHQEVTLPDGSLLAVGASSVVTVQMRADERRIHLREGEAYFKVQKDSSRPFVVEAGDISITALGTAFDVRRTGRNVAVSVTEGRVRVMRPLGAALDVGAGERVAYEPGTQRFQTSAVSAQRALAWRERRLEFVNEPLEVVIANVNRYASTSIEIADPAAARLTFTGTVLPEELPSWLNALPSVLPVRVERSGDDVRLESASKP